MKIMIATPAYAGQVYISYMASVMNVFAEANEAGIQVVFRPVVDSLITRARNVLVNEFLNDPGYTHLFFIDADIGFTTDQFWRLINSDHEVACGIYPKKAYFPPNQPPTAIGGDLMLTMMNYVVNSMGPQFIIEEDKFTEVLDGGTGFMMIKREVFEKLKEEYPSLKQEAEDGDSTNLYGFFDCYTDETDRPLSEDYAFCRRVQSIGYRVMADVASRLSHTGVVTFDGDFYRSKTLLGQTVTNPPTTVKKKPVRKKKVSE